MVNVGRKFYIVLFFSLFFSALMIANNNYLRNKSHSKYNIGHLYLFVERVVEKGVGYYHKLSVAHFFSILFFAFYLSLISWSLLLFIGNIHFCDFKFCLYIHNSQNLWKAEVLGRRIQLSTWLCTSRHEINLFKTQLVISSPLLQPKQVHLSLAASFHPVAQVIFLA